MQTVNVKEARDNISRLLNAVESGEKIIITRRGKAVAKLEMVTESELQPVFPDRGAFRAGLPPCSVSSTELLRDMRNERG